MDKAEQIFSKLAEEMGIFDKIAPSVVGGSSAILTAMKTHPIREWEEFEKAHKGMPPKSYPGYNIHAMKRRYHAVRGTAKTLFPLIVGAGAYKLTKYLRDSDGQS